jgi:hypothetical protein
MFAKEGEVCPLTEDRLADTDWDFLLDLVSNAESTREKDYKSLMNSLSRSIGRANLKIRNAGFPQEYEITAKGTSRPKRYGLDLDRNQIHFAEN